MTCQTCGHELDPQGVCANCAAVVNAQASPVTSGDACPPSVLPPEKTKTNPLLIFLCLLLSLGFSVLVIGMNYVRALRWAGEINAESFGYMIGGVLVGFALGFVAMFVVKKLHRQKIPWAYKAVGVTGVAVFTSFLALVGEFAGSVTGSPENTKQRMGDLMKEAAGTKPISANKRWWDGPTREFYRDILENNQQYSAEVAALDSSAIKDLYSVESYTGKPHMEKVVEQLKAALAVEEKYSSLDTIMKRMEDRMANAKASFTEKQAFMKSMRETFEKSMEPRNGLLRTEEVWMKSTVDLYEFAIEHSSEYSVKTKKLYFRNDQAREEFVSRQAQAIAQHKDFLKAKDAFEQSRRSKMNEVGLAPSDFTPAQLGKPK